MTFKTNQCAVCGHPKHRGVCGVGMPRKRTSRDRNKAPHRDPKTGRCDCTYPGVTEGKAR